MKNICTVSRDLLLLALLCVAAPAVVQAQGPVSDSNVRSLVGRISLGMAGLGISEVFGNGLVAACGPTVEPEGGFEIPLLVGTSSANLPEVFSCSPPSASGSATVKSGMLIMHATASAHTGRSIVIYTWYFETASGTQVLYTGEDPSAAVTRPTGSGTLYLRVTDNRGDWTTVAVAIDGVPAALPPRRTSCSATSSTPTSGRPGPGERQRVKVMSKQQIEKVSSALAMYRSGGLKEIRLMSSWGIGGNLLCVPPPPLKFLARLDVLSRDIDTLGRVLVRVEPGVIRYTNRLTPNIPASPTLERPFAALVEAHSLANTVFRPDQP